MGQYHSRFSDLPLSICEAQLRLWDRPPIIESAAAGWIHLGLAAVAMRRQQVTVAKARLKRVSQGAEAAAHLESALLAARIRSDEGKSPEDHLRRAQSLAQEIQQPVMRTDYLARVADQRAYRLTHPDRGEANIQGALDIYEAIPKEHLSFFGQFKRFHGIAFCLHRLGRTEEALRSAQLALEAAGDAGLTRFRAMVLTMLARLSDNDRQKRSYEHRAKTLAQSLGHEDLGEPMGH